MNNVAVVGIGVTKFGELWNESLRNLLAKSQLSAINDAKLSPKQIDMIITGNMLAGEFAGQNHLGAMASEILNINAPSYRIEGACASGSLALQSGINAIKSGKAEIVLVNGVEKMTDIAVGQVNSGIMSAADEETEGYSGATFCGLYAMMARAYMHQYSLTREQLALVSVKNHKHGSLNPIAQFRNEITVEQVLQSSMIADPLTILDCSPISDGAASVILASENFARKITDTPIWITGSGQATDTIALHKRKSLIDMPATKIAAAQAFTQSKISPNQISITEVHDCFTIAEILAMEGLGLVEQGAAGKAVEQGITYFDGKIPINPCGGLKACGHPIGATGIKQVVEVVTQLRGEAGKRQVNNPIYGLTHNVGGTGATVAVNIFKRD